MDNNLPERASNNQLQNSGKLTENFLTTINPRTVADIIVSKNPSLIRLIKEQGEAPVKALIRELIFDLIEFFSLGKSMNAPQVDQTIDLMLEVYPQYKFDDWKLCFKMAKLGQFGTVYDRIDGNVIFDWFDKYLGIRFSEFEAHRAIENRMLNEPIKSDPLVPMPEYVKELIDKKVITKEPERPLNQTDRQKQINEWLSEFDKIWNDQGAKDGKRFIMHNDIKMDQAEFLQFKASQETV